MHIAHILTCLLHIPAANVCPDITNFANASVSTMSAVESVVVRVTCHDGYEYATRLTEKWTLCQADLTWNDTDLDCHGKYSK